MFFYLFNSAELRKAGRDFRKARRDFRKADREPELLLPDHLHPDPVLILHPEAHHQVDQKRPVSERKCVKETKFVKKREPDQRVFFFLFNSAEFREAGRDFRKARRDFREAGGDFRKAGGATTRPPGPPPGRSATQRQPS